MDVAGIKEMVNVDYVRSGALVVAFLAVALRDRRTWYMADMLGSFATGLTLIAAPHILLGYTTNGELDVIHLHFERFQSIGFLVGAYHIWVLRKTSDETAHVAHLTSRVVGLSVHLGVSLTAHARFAKSFNQQNLSFALLGMLLCLVGNVLHLLRTGDYGGWTIRSNSTNSLLRLMSWLLGMMSLGYIAYPEVILKNMSYKFSPNPIHGNIVRTLGAQYLSGMVSNYMAAEFRDNDNKRQIFFNSLLCFLLGFGLCFHSGYWLKLFTQEELIPGICLGLFMMLLSLTGYYVSRKPKTQ